MAEATEAKKVPSKVAGEIVEIDLSSVRQARALKRRKKLNLPTINLSKIQEDRVSRNQAFEQFGITAGVVLQTHLDNLQAVSFLTIGHGSSRKLYAVPDYKTRQKAVEAALKLLGLIRGDEDLAASRPVVINMLPGTLEKVETLIGGPLQLASGEVIEMQDQTPANAETNETETADETALEGNGILEQTDRPGPQPGGQNDREGVEQAERPGAALAGPDVYESDGEAGDGDGDAAADPEGPAPDPENGDEDYNFSFE